MGGREAVGAAGPLLKTNEPVRRMLRFHAGGVTWHPVWSEAEPGARRTVEKSIDPRLGSMHQGKNPSEGQWPDRQWLPLVTPAADRGAGLPMAYSSLWGSSSSSSKQSVSFDGPFSNRDPGVLPSLGTHFRLEPLSFFFVLM